MARWLKVASPGRMSLAWDHVLPMSVEPRRVSFSRAFYLAGLESSNRPSASLRLRINASAVVAEAGGGRYP
jgi:hypothetical protein